MSKKNIDVSVVLPSRNEGESVRKVLDELIAVLRQEGKSFEIIAINSPTEKNNSFETFKEYADKYENITAINLLDKRPAGDGKTVQYMIGFEMAQGDVIVQIDSDGQDNPADLPKFFAKLDEGYDMVTGYKQKRKDGSFYMFTSKIGNTLTRMLTGIEVHDMNCGFKAYRAEVAKSVNLKGRWYRYIPSILQSRGFKIAEVPIESRKREFGKSNFNLINRVEGGGFDMPMIVIMNYMGGTPFYFFGWLAVALFGVASLLILSAIFLFDTTYLFERVFLLVAGSAAVVTGFVSLIIGIAVDFLRSQIVTPLESYNIGEVYTKK